MGLGTRRSCTHTLPTASLLPDGFPVIDPLTKAFLGLVRRDQIIALIECGQFEDVTDEEVDMDGSNNTTSSDSRSKRLWTPKAGVTKTPLMHYAYHIKDDRYDHISEPSKSQESTETLLAEDDYDAHDWLISLRRNREYFPGFNVAGENLLDSNLPRFGELLRTTLPGLSEGHRGAVVGVNKKGTVYIKWLPPGNRVKYVNLGAVMNRGTYCVTEFCPVSKALSMFTKLGLRHLVVVGGGGGSQVVGMITRINLLRQYIKEVAAESAALERR